ncbi:MAG TPA: energy transducer TonB [Chthoniobacterales bacterium]|nr:energy transducer TonB [Chthoniobacterales bacterium]
MQTYAWKSAVRSAICGAVVALLVGLPLSTANAKWLSKNNPRLPVGVYFQGLQGSVILSLILDKSGRVTDTRVLKSSGHGALDELALEAAATWRLSPDAVLATDISQGRVELVKFRNPNPPSRILPDAKPRWARLK